MRKALRASAAALLVSGALSASACAEEIQVVLAGKYHSPISGYKVGSTYYLTAKEAGQVYGGQVYWYPVAGRVQMSFRGKAVQFLADSTVATVGGARVEMDTAVLSRASQALIPLSFFLSREFSAWSEMVSQFNPRTRLLTVDRRSTVGAPRWYSYEDFTRLVVEIEPGQAYAASARGVGGLDVTLPFGVIEASEEGSIGDGILDTFSLRQESKIARLRVAFSRGGAHWRLLEFKEPRRLALDVYRPGTAAPTRAIVEPNKAPSSPPPAAKAPAERPQTAVAAAPAQAKPAPQARIAPAPAAPTPPVVTMSGKPKRRIVIDAGHGGKDSGAVGRRGTYEKDINLSTALELAKLLRQEEAFDVLLTRTDDTFVPLGDRSRLANEFNADLFVSLHCNASTDKQESGFELYFLSEQASDPEAERMAEIENSVLAFEGKSARDDEASPILLAMTKTEHINAASELSGYLSKTLGKRLDIDNRGVKQAAFYVLRGTNAPAILFEMAFVSNQKDEAKLESAKYRRRIVDGVYAGLLDYAKGQGWLASR